MEGKDIAFIVAGLVVAVIVYKRFIHRTGDKPHKPAVILLSALMLLGIYYTNRPFLAIHGETIISIVVVFLLILVIMDAYESDFGEGANRIKIKVDSSGNVTQF